MPGLKVSTDLRLCLRFREVAWLLGLSEVTVKRHAAKGQLPTVLIGERSRRIPTDALHKLTGSTAVQFSEDRILSGPEVAGVLAISSAQAALLIRCGDLPTVPWGRGRRVPLGRLRSYIKENTEGRHGH